MAFHNTSIHTLCLLIFIYQHVEALMRASDPLLLAVEEGDPIVQYTLSSKTVKEHLRAAATYQKRFAYVWISGPGVASLSFGFQGPPPEVIDARQNRYSQALIVWLTAKEASRFVVSRNRHQACGGLPVGKKRFEEKARENLTRG